MSNKFFERKIKNIFKNIYDTNNDDFITWEDFDLSVEKFRIANNLKADDKKVVDVRAGLRGFFNLLLAKTDTNKDNKISFEEYLTYWKSVQEQIKKGASFEDLDLKELIAFSIGGLDIDGDGIYSESDFKGAVRSLNVYTEEDINTAWQKLAKLGPLDYKAFEKAFLVFFSSDNEQDPENYLAGPITVKL